MKNADKFKDVFGLYATELWAMPEEEFLRWLNSESTETEQRWIPCNEKLPNDDKPVLLTEELRFPDGRRRKDVCMASYDSQNMTWYEILGANTLEIPYPIAWMELPEPYQEENKHEKAYQDIRDGIKDEPTIEPKCEECRYLNQILLDDGK